MDTIIKEELWRCIGTFGLSVFIFGALSRGILRLSIFTILGIPFMIALFVFLTFVIIRKKYFNGIIIVTLLVGFLMMNGGFILSYLQGFNIHSISLIIFGGVMLIYDIIKLSKSKK